MRPCRVAVGIREGTVDREGDERHRMAGDKTNRGSTVAVSVWKGNVSRRWIITHCVQHNTNRPENRTIILEWTTKTGQVEEPISDDRYSILIIETYYH